jgi:hypothetical protein
MPANLNDVGIQASSLTLLETVDYSKKLEEAVIMDSDSSFGDAEAFNPIIEFSLKGRGDLPSGIAIGTDGGASGAVDLTGINDGSGTLIITSVKQSESNTDFNAWECSGTYYPSA